MGCCLSNGRYGRSHVKPGYEQREQYSNLFELFGDIKSFIHGINSDIEPQTKHLLGSFLNNYDKLIEILKEYYEHHGTSEHCTYSTKSRMSPEYPIISNVHTVISGHGAPAIQSFQNSKLESSTSEVLELKAKARKLEEELQDKVAIISRQNTEIKDITSRLAQEMSNKVSANEGAIENVSIINRPMNIANEYQLFCSNVWLDAKFYLDKKFPQKPEEDKLQLLCFILEVTQANCFQIYDETMEVIRKSIKDSPITDPIKYVTATKKTEVNDDTKRPEQDITKDDFQIPLEIKNTIRDYMRNNSDKIELKGLIKRVKKEIKTKKKSESTTYPFLMLWEKNTTKVLKTYMTKSARLVWKMSIQSPKMQFRTTGLDQNWMGDKYQDPHWGGDDPNDPRCKVVCYGYPMLYQQNALMAKGKVYLKKCNIQEETISD